MLQQEKCLKGIKEKGGRLTKLRKSLVDILCNCSCLTNSSDIQRALKKQGLMPDRSTLYREFLYLVDNNILKKSVIAGADHYEIAGHHHHHLICKGCKSIKMVFPDCSLDAAQKKLNKENDFYIDDHVLDFFGYCKKCKKKERK